MEVWIKHLIRLDLDLEVRCRLHQDLRVQHPLSPTGHAVASDGRWSCFSPFAVPREEKEPLRLQCRPEVFPGGQTTQHCPLVSDSVYLKLLRTT